jgi:ceramide glucosyltransferase
MRKDLLDTCGGMQAFADVLAEDYFFGMAFAKRGWKSAVSHLPALQNGMEIDARLFRQRMCRWARLRIAMLPHMIVLEPSQECLISAIFGACAIGYLTQNVYFSFVFIGWHILYWAICDYTLITIVQNSPLPFSILQFAVCWLYRELMAFPIYMMALLNPEIKWKNSSYKLSWGGRIKPLYRNN